MKTKLCTKCKEEKLVTEFYKQGTHYLVSECKPCTRKRRTEYHHTKEGLISIIYNTQRKSSYKRNHELPSYTLLELRTWALAQEIFHKLHANWVDSDHQKKLTPSFDRLNDYKMYSLNNLQIVTWAENEAKGWMDRKNGSNNKHSKAVIQMTKLGEVIKEFHSASQASREAVVNLGNISLCCNGKRKSAGGFLWKYVN